MDPDRPWLDRIVLPDPLPTRFEEAESELDDLREIQAHREWVIDGLRAHIDNVEADLEKSRKRVAKLEEHTRNLAERKGELAKHVENLESEAKKREAYLADLEIHIENFERRQSRRPCDLGGSGIFPSSRYPRLQGLFELGDEIREGRKDLQRRYPKDAAANYWYWLMWHGARAFPEVVEARYPEPDEYLRKRVVGEGSARDRYVQSGLVDWWTLDGCLRKGGFDPREGGSILDFGVGCGRIIQHFALYSGVCQLYGADVDSDAIAWCRKKLDFASFEHLPLKPGTPFADGQFDAIYAFSVFSHLPEKLHRGWLEELHRIAAPGASVVLTVQGRNVVEAVLDGSWSEPFPDARTLRKALPELERTGFLFFPYEGFAYSDRENRRLTKILDHANYGSTFILDSYIRESWSDLFEIVGYEDAPDDWQDYVILKRRP